ncbi:hypothetical protein [Roseomonas sp. BN140053]|uniref:hypothetical protein n=1 Tax=Roseomonas sp. BN140053 TaxID=3391898 RepID=UPI0039EC53D0
MTKTIETSPPRSRAWRKILMIFGVLAVLASAAVFTVFAFTGEAVKGAESFLQTNAVQGPDAAWRQASRGFQAATTAEGWAALSRSQGLAGYAGASWNRRSVSGHEATLSGTISLADGGRVPAEVRLIEDASGWKVHSFVFGTAGASAGLGSPTEMIAGERIANVCREILAQQSNFQLDGATCPSIAATKGAVAECTATRGTASGPMRVTIQAIDVDGDINIGCVANLGAPAQ